jgi:hypothetical protein
MITKLFALARRIPLVAYAIILLCAYIAASEIRVHLANARAESAAFRADSVEAAASTTQQIGHAYFRRAVQAEVARDAIDRKLKTETKARQDLELQLAGGQTTDTSAITVDPTGASSATFSTKVAPANVDVIVTWPRTGDARAAFTVAFDPIHINASLRCSDLRVDGVRQALVYVEPVGIDMKVTVRSATQDRGVCQPELAAPRSHAKAALVVGGILGLTAGYLLFH